MKYRLFGRNTTLREGQTFGSCCGSKYIENKIPVKWKNQFGEGVKPGKTADMIVGNTRGIAITEGIVGEQGEFNGFVVSHIQTKNGPVTVSVRKV